MSEKSEEPTPKKLRDARMKGQVAKSQDINAAFLFITAFSVLIAIGGGLTANLKVLMKEYFEKISSPDLTADAYNTLGVDVLFRLLGFVMPILIANFIVAVFVNYFQVGSLFTFQTMKPELKKLNPLNKIKQWFSPMAVIELLKSSIKLTICLVMAYVILKDSMRPLVLSVGKDLSNVSFFLKDMMWSFTIRVAVVFILIAAGDYFLQKKQHMKQLKMSKDEVKREYKQEEGDPMYKSKRKQMHQEFAMNSQMNNVKKATVVVVNPTHIAVAVLYDREKGGAPEILAKGQRLMADKIKELAKEYGVPIMRNVSLAQALNKLEVGEYIPEELYEAVAEVLNFVYKMGQHR